MGGAGAGQLVRAGYPLLGVACSLGTGTSISYYYAVKLPCFEPRLGPALQSGCPSSGDARPGRVLFGSV